MRGIYNYIPETNHVFTVCSVSAVLLSLFLLHVVLFPMVNVLYLYIITFRRICTVANMAVFCSSLILCFPCPLLRYFINYFEMVLISPVITDITFVFTFHMRCFSVVRFLYNYCHRHHPCHLLYAGYVQLHT